MGTLTHAYKGLIGCIYTAGLDAQIRFFFRLTSSFKSDLYAIFAFILYTAETTKCRRSDLEKGVKQHKMQWMQM